MQEIKAQIREVQLMLENHMRDDSRQFDQVSRKLDKLETEQTSIAEEIHKFRGVLTFLGWAIATILSGIEIVTKLMGH